MTSYPSTYSITPSIFMTSYPIRMLSPYCFHDNTTTIPDISPTIFDITATVSMSSHRWHTHLYQCIAVSMTSQVCKSSHLAHVRQHTQSTSHHIHTLWHQWSCFMTSQTLHSWHQISSIWHYIHSLWLHTIIVMTLHPLHSWHHTPYIWNHTHSNTNIISAIWPTISNTTSTLSVSSNPGYQFYHTHSLYDITHTLRVTPY